MAFFFSFLFFFISIIFLIIASFTDLKSRIVSNKLNYSMLFIGLALHALQVFLQQDLQILSFTVFAVVATFLASLLLWKLGVWAGGDVKLFTALAALNPVNPAFIPQLLGYSQGLLAPLSLPVFPLTLFIFSIFAMMPLGIIIGVRGIFKSKKLKARFSADIAKIVFFEFFLSLAIVGFEKWFSFFGISALLLVIGLIALALLPKRLQPLASAIIFIAAFSVSSAYSVFSEFLQVFAFLFAVSVFLKLFFTARSEVLIVSRKISSLGEGEIVAESIVKTRKGVERFEGLSLRETFKYLKSNNLAGLLKALKPKGKLIADRHSAAGLTLEELKELKRLVKARKLKDSIRVKLSTAFVPGVLIAYLILAFAVDAFWRILF